MTGGTNPARARRPPVLADRPIGFYVHHSGRGHLDRTRAVVDALGDHPSVVVTSHPDAPGVLPDVPVTLLATDVPEGPLGDVTAGGSFHWTPERPDMSVSRCRQLLEWADRHRPSLVVVDVSVEVTVYLRLLGIAVVPVRLHGARDDDAHRLGNRVAEAFLAPYPALLEDPATAAAVRTRTRYCGVIAPLVPPERHLRPDRPPGASVGGRRSVLVLWGTGSPPPTGPDLDAAASATPAWDWSMLGPEPPVRPPTVVQHRGWVDDVASAVAGADVVVGPPGDGTLGAIAAAGARFVAVPQDRPFGEQVQKAELLAFHDLAVICPTWPRPVGWADVLDQAMHLDPARLSLLEADGAPARAAASLVDLARQVAARCP